MTETTGKRTRKHVTAEERLTIGKALRKKYDSDEKPSIRELADANGFKYGFTRRALLDAGTVLRPAPGRSTKAAD